jgi:hypothetical protein
MAGVLLRFASDARDTGFVGDPGAIYLNEK